MKKRLPGLIWLTVVAVYAFKRFGPKDPVAWARSITRRGALVSEDPSVAAQVHDAVALSGRDGRLAEAVDIGTSVLGDRSFTPS